MPAVLAAIHDELAVTFWLVQQPQKVSERRAVGARTRLLERLEVMEGKGESMMVERGVEMVR